MSFVLSISTPDDDEWSTSRLGCLNLGERDAITHCWADHRAILDEVEDRTPCFQLQILQTSIP